MGRMARLECPICGTKLDAEPGQTATCPKCGFSAPYDNAHEASGAGPAIPDVETARQEAPSQSPGPWAYLFGVIGLLTFWLAAYLVPFVFGVAAVTLGITARVRDPDERRSIPAIVLGALAVIAGGIMLVV